MLELKGIYKEYPAGNGKVEALKGIDLCLRDSEFVSVLGPSGCGKTTTLNIIGGLDQYTSGDLIINGKSTKDFTDREWDAYRNHSVGFVFQNYNLISHQTVLQNVELALSLSGVSKAERRRRATEALARVGLSDQLQKKPGEMSGGQMQRVAIARAIVNDPDIILADEPTGALDTQTSVQVMEILKEISKDRLVIMVTHNPELAEKYSTRIVRMLDGEIQSDSMPITEEEELPVRHKEEKILKKKLPSMSFATAFGLSLKNLFTKKSRTILTSFAGSIGIIGIALIFAVSQGMTAYINFVQEETLSSYPLTIEARHMDIGTLMRTFLGQAQSSHDHDKDAVYQKSLVYNMIKSLSSMETKENDLKSFREYIEREHADPETDTGLYDALSGVQYTYGLDLLIYTKDTQGRVLRSDTRELMQSFLMENFGMEFTDTSDSGTAGAGGMQGFSSMSAMSSAAMLWQEMLPGDNGKVINPVLEKQYDLLYGDWPTAYDEIVLVVDENNELDDMSLYALGLKTKEELQAISEAAKEESAPEFKSESWSYEEICNMDFRTVLNCDCYQRDEESGLYIDLRETDAGLSYLYDNGIRLRVSGIIRPNEDTISPMLTGSIGYTSLLTEYVIERTSESAAVKEQTENPTVDIFTGLPFRENADKMSDADKKAEFIRYVGGMNEKEKAMLYTKIVSTPSDEQVTAAVEKTVGMMSRADMENQMIAAMAQQMHMSETEVRKYLTDMSDESIRDLFGKSVAEQYKMQYAAEAVKQLAFMTPTQLAAALEASMQTYTDAQYAFYYDTQLEFSKSDLDANQKMLGSVDLETPATINLFAASFEDKDVIIDAIAAYNDTVPELEQIQYTDYVGILMSSVTTIINAITYVLIAFVAISLVVSSIMIGVITLISVQERTKEIGILRAIGASKRNVSSIFNAETVIIGLAAGLIGVGLTYLLCVPINMILHALTGISNLRAFLPIPAALLLVAISVILTLISGIIPSKSAAKKDPVVALRTE